MLEMNEINDKTFPIPLKVIKQLTVVPNAPRYDQLSDDVNNAPIKPDPPISSWPYLLAPSALHLRLKGNEGAGFGCSSRCTFCEARNLPGGTGDGSRQPEADMSLETWEKLKKAGWLENTNGVELAGLAEPLLAKNFPVIAAEVLAAAKTLYFPTNGHFLDTAMTDCLGDGTNVVVSISIDAGDPQTYLAIGRGVKDGDWDKMKAAVKAFRIKCPNAKLHSQFTAGLYNQATFPDFIDLCAELGIPDVKWRLVQTHTVAREDVSLRFAKDLTESTLSEGWHRAQKNQIVIDAERRGYAEEDGLENSLTEPDADTPDAKAARYLSFVPFQYIVCNGATTYISNSTNHCTTYLDSGTTITTLVNPQSTNVTIIYTNTTVCANSTCTQTTWTTGPVQSGTSYFGTATFGECPSGWSPQSDDGEAKIVRSVVIPRAQAARFQPESVETKPAAMTKDVRHCDAAIIAWADNTISSCFSKGHVVASADTPWSEAILNPRYQTFLQKRNGADGGVYNEDWCMSCPRNF